MLDLLNFFADAAETASDDAGTGGGSTQWLVYVVFGVLIVGMIVWMVLSQRKQKKRAEEMMSNLVMGSVVTTIGGIVGEVVQLDDKHVWLSTGTEDNKTVMQFLRQAVHSVTPAISTTEADASAQTEMDKAEEIDEIK